MAKAGMTLMNGRNETEENGVQSGKSIGKSGSVRHFSVRTKLLAESYLIRLASTANLPSVV